MPHLVVQYSANLDAVTDMQALCSTLNRVMVDTGLFPLGGIRVRAFPCTAHAIADLDRKNGFADMVLRMGAGRSEADRKRAGEAIMAAARAHFQTQLDEPYFALSLEVVEIDPDLSWKVNSIHPRLKKPDDHRT